MARLLSDRLMTLLRAEISAFERTPATPPVGTAGGEHAGDAAGPGKRGGAGARNAGGAERKERIDALSLMTRTLEKLLDLKRLETLTMEGGGEDDAQTLRLRAELIVRLKALDARRQSERRLFESESGAGGGVPIERNEEPAGTTAGDMPPMLDPVEEPQASRGEG